MDSRRISGWLVSLWFPLVSLASVLNRRMESYRDEVSVLGGGVMQGPSGRGLRVGLERSPAGRVDAWLTCRRFSSVGPTGSPPCATANLPAMIDSWASSKQ